MVTDPPKINEAGKYSINDAVKILGISKRTLFDHRIQGLIKTSYGRNGRPFFYGRDLKRYWNTI